MTTTKRWIVSDVVGPPRHARLRAKFDEAVQRGESVRLCSAAPPPLSGLQRAREIETLMVGGHAFQARGRRVVEGRWD